MKIKKSRALSVLLAVTLCVTAFCMTSFVYADAAPEAAYALPPDGSGTPAVDAPVETAAPAEEPTEPEKGGVVEIPSDIDDLLSALTPDGNLSLIDDFLFTAVNADGEKEEKQFITVVSKAGNYYYIVIDRAGDTENVYFLNLVDEADLLALMDEPEEEVEPVVCTCDDKCYTGHVDTTCPVCAVNLTACAGKEPEPEPTPTPELTAEPEEEPQQKGSAAGTAVVIVLILAVAGGAAYYVLKMRGAKPQPQTAGEDDLDEYDFGAEDEGNADEYANFPPLSEDTGEYQPDPNDTGYWPDSGGYGPDSEGDEADK